MVNKHGSKDDLVFLLIARMLWDKGILEYYEAAKAIKKVYPFCRFQLLGPTGVENRTAIPEETIQYWVNEGVIEYLPETADVRPFIAESDVVVLPSYREGLPKSLLEAACMGKPLIATDVPGCRDLLSNANGFLCQEKNSKSLEKAIESMIHQTKEARLQMGKKSRELVLQGFTERIVVQKYLNRI
jgi:glycosyltransferase involved in cell wall biosynthesis